MFRSCGVKKLLILAVAPKVPENWQNLSAMLNLLDMESIEDVTGDLKICKYLKQYSFIKYKYKFLKTNYHKFNIFKTICWWENPVVNLHLAVLSVTYRNLITVNPITC